MWSNHKEKSRECFRDAHPVPPHDLQQQSRLSSHTSLASLCKPQSSPEPSRHTQSPRHTGDLCRSESRVRAVRKDHVDRIDVPTQNADQRDEQPARSAHDAPHPCRGVPHAPSVDWKASAGENCHRNRIHGQIPAPASYCRESLLRRTPRFDTPSF